MFCDNTAILLMKHFSPTDEVSTALQASIMSTVESVSQFILRRLTMNELQDVSNFRLQELLLQPITAVAFPCPHSPDQPGKGHFFGVMVSPEATLGSRATIDFQTAQCRAVKCPEAAAAEGRMVILAHSLINLDLSRQMEEMIDGNGREWAAVKTKEKGQLATSCGKPEAVRFQL